MLRPYDLIIRPFLLLLYLNLQPANLFKNIFFITGLKDWPAYVFKKNHIF